MIFKSDHRRSTIRRRLVISLVLVGVGVTAWAAKQIFGTSINSPSESWVLTENTGNFVIGNLGGVHVSIPRPYARLVEYDADPSFMERRKGPVPKRNFESKIRSFGMELYFPDMQPSAEKYRDNAKLASANRITAAIKSGEAYKFFGPDPMTVFSDKRIDSASILFKYQPIDATKYDLVGIAPVGTNLARREIGGGGADLGDKNIYRHVNERGNVEAHIECSNMNHKRALCEHDFLLEPRMHVYVSILYPRELLSQWHHIQDSIVDIILSFEVDLSRSQR